MTVRTRLTLGVVLLLLAAFAALGAVIVETTRGILIDQVDARVLEAVKGRGGPPGGRGDGRSPGRGGDEGRPEPGPGEATGDGDDDEPRLRSIARLVYGPNGGMVLALPSGYPNDPDPLPYLSEEGPGDAPAPLDRIVTLPAVEGPLRYRALVERGPDGALVVTAAPLSDVDEAIASILRAVALAGALAAAVAAVGTWWIIRQGFRPVDRMIDTAAAIAGGDLTRRAPDADPRSELGRLGAALNDMLAQIERALQARAASEERLRRFVADAAHELRTPLTSVRGYAELYRQGALATPEAVDGAMGRIESEGGRMARLVDDLLLLARLDRQRGVEVERVDLAALAREAADDFAAVEPDRPFARDLAPHAYVMGDRIRLRQIVDNLLANVRAHAGPGTPARLAVGVGGDAVELVVADAGPGIPPEFRDKVFERFWRADPGRARRTGGSGLGLAIVASLVEAHGGAIDVASEPGRGATFTVRLPRA